MRYECSVFMLVFFNFLYVIVQGKPLGEDADITSTIKSLRQEIHKVQHFIDHLNIIRLKETGSKDDNGRTVIPYTKQLNHLLQDESVIKATAQKAATAVAESAKATLKTQKGVKQIAVGLVQLKNCLQKFEKTIKL